MCRLLDADMTMLDVFWAYTRRICMQEAIMFIGLYFVRVDLFNKVRSTYLF